MSTGSCICGEFESMRVYCPCHRTSGQSADLARYFKTVLKSRSVDYGKTARTRGVATGFDMRERSDKRKAGLTRVSSAKLGPSLQR